MHSLVYCIILLTISLLDKAYGIDSINVPSESENVQILKSACDYHKCPVGHICVPFRGNPLCVCNHYCSKSSTTGQLCAWNGRTFESLCQLRTEECKTGKYITVHHYGPCKNRRSKCNLLWVYPFFRIVQRSLSFCQVLPKVCYFHLNAPPHLKNLLARESRWKQVRKLCQRFLWFCEFFVIFGFFRDFFWDFLFGIFFCKVSKILLTCLPLGNISFFNPEMILESELLIFKT